MGKSDRNQKTGLMWFRPWSPFGLFGFWILDWRLLHALEFCLEKLSNLCGGCMRQRDMWETLTCQLVFLNCCKCLAKFRLRENIKLMGIFTWNYLFSNWAGCTCTKRFCMQLTINGTGEKTPTRVYMYLHHWSSRFVPRRRNQGTPCTCCEKGDKSLQSDWKNRTHLQAPEF